ncbi:DUF6301 family protein [Thermomonospora cellulosilytica]|uniref:Uncharacterized protein n=1 Tax=Thermomonospora cellulosilytica TaxID=1411118 RepID=A0A7W3MTZ7_9ACTN|nr:DUF6301 family protein [Thermomonospora cellulosilytica]MBA9001807.1 hypothetical protein [Thermomonospora cellulosilytica]
MARVAGLRYCLWDDFLPVFLIDVDDGGLEAWVYDGESGGFRSSLGHVRVMFDPYTPSDQLTREEFIQEVEARRARDMERGLLKWEGPVVPLYETMLALLKRERLSSEERALVRNLSMRTHAMFEAELRERGGLGLPEVGDPMPVDPRLSEPISPDWRVLPDDLVGEFARRLAGLGAALQSRDAAAVAAALGRPIAEDTGNRWRLDSGLPLTKGDIWIEDRDGYLTVDVPLTDSGNESRPAFSRFLFREFKRAAEVVQAVYDRRYRETGGRWPERSWEADGVGIFLRRGATCVHLLAMPQEQAAERFEQVVRESMME